MGGDLSFWPENCPGVEERVYPEARRSSNDEEELA